MKQDQFIELMRKMHEGIVCFSYKKNDGTTRNAIGTLNEYILPRENMDKLRDVKRVTPKHLFTYYDVEKQQFRCFKRENFIGIK